MFSFIQKLFPPRRLIEHPDSFALTRETLHAGILDAIRLQQSLGKSVWLVCHFPDVFTQCQTMLDREWIDYQIVDRHTDLNWLQDNRSDLFSHVQLALSDMLVPEHWSGEVGESTPWLDGRMAMMVAERHPYGPRDESLVAFAALFPATVEIGHYVSFDDPVLEQRIPPRAIEVLKSLGMQGNELISSIAVSSRIQKQIRKESATRQITEEADSAAQWYEIHDRSNN